MSSGARPDLRITLRLDELDMRDRSCKRGSTWCSDRDPHPPQVEPTVSCFRLPHLQTASATFQGNRSPRACGWARRVHVAPAPFPALRGLDAIAPRQRSGMASTILANKETVWNGEQVAAAARRSSSGGSSGRCLQLSQAAGHHHRRCPDGERDCDAEFYYFHILVALVVLRFLPCSLQGYGPL